MAAVMLGDQGSWSRSHNVVLLLLLNHNYQIFELEPGVN
jgi:hypothetical protein